MIKLIGKSEKTFFKGSLSKKFVSLPKNFVRHIFSGNYQNSIFFRVLLFVLEKNALLSILTLFGEIFKGL